MNVLLTGATGFVGKNLQPYLQGSHTVTTVSIRNGVPAIGLETDVVVHLAGMAHDLKNTADPEGYFAVNYEMTRQLYDAFLQSKASKFIFISSVKAAADSLSIPLTENVKPNPTTVYGKSKLMAEQYIESILLPEGKSYYILRPCMIHGPGNKGNLNLLYKFVKTGIPYPFAAFKNSRSYLSVENLCFIIKKLIDGNVPNGIYNVADDVALSTNEVIGILSAAQGKHGRLLPIPLSFVKVLARIGDFLHLPINTERLGKLTETYVVDNVKIKNAIGSALPVTASAGLAKTATSFSEG